MSPRPTSDPLTTSYFYWAEVHGLVSLHLAGKLRMGHSLSELAAALSRTESTSRS